MNQPAFLSPNTISYSKSLPTTTPEFTEALVAWCKASTPEDPIGVLEGFHEAQRTMIEAEAAAKEDPAGEAGKVWDALCVAYKANSNNKVLSLLKALDQADLWFVLESNSGKQKLISRTETEIIARCEFPLFSSYKTVTETLSLVLAIYGPRPKTD
jgi:hypothetical protein